jgi:hypothetical protein
LHFKPEIFFLDSAALDGHGRQFWGADGAPIGPDWEEHLLQRPRGEVNDELMFWI